VNVSTGILPGGETRTATFRATDTDTGATDDGTLTLYRLDGTLAGFELTGGDGADVFLPPNGDGTIRGGAGDDVLLALSVSGDLVALGEAGFDSLQVEGLDGNLLLDGGTGGSLVVANGVTGSAELRTGSEGGQATGTMVGGSLILRGGAGTDQLIATANLGTVLLEGGAGNDVLSAFGNALGAVMDGGAGADVYAGDPAAGRTVGNTIILRRGETAGDQISAFDGAAGDRILLMGFGMGATLTQGAAPSEWRVTASDGAEELFVVQGAGFDAGTDVLWM
jgi:Ca2+-binding RTX toxin-like protein